MNRPRSTGSREVELSYMCELVRYIAGAGRCTRSFFVAKVTSVSVSVDERGAAGRPRPRKPEARSRQMQACLENRTSLRQSG
jgi:hypothetical protein